MGKVTRQQAIRLKNTLLAAAGGVTLSCVLLVGHFTQALLLSGAWLVAYLALLWLGNLTIIATIVSGKNLRFRDPALSLVQMYWAISITALALLLSSKLDIGIYLFLLVILAFGIFRVSVRQFNFICAFAILTLLLVHGLRLMLLESQANLVLVGLQWLVFSFCTFTLTRLCQSIVTLRNRLRQKNEQLQEALDAKQQFLANMSHEIRTPMNGVLGMLDIVMGEDMPAKQRRYLSIVQSSATSLLAVINDILDFSKMEAGKLKIEPVVFDLTQLIGEVIDIFNAKAAAKGLEMVLDMPADMPTQIIADPQRIRQILNNLLGNALKFTEQGNVVVAVELRGGELLAAGAERPQPPYALCWQVRDTGIGVDDDNVEQLFDSFTQADSSTTRSYGGAGLGLAICKQLCLLMGGDISVCGAVGKGSCFEFIIPVDLPAQPAPSSAASPNIISGRRVLLVDDNQACLDALQKQLESAGAHVIAASSAAQLMPLLEAQKEANFAPDVAIVDLQMPKSCGITVTQQMRAIPDYQALPVILLISTLDEISEERTRELRISQCVYKPVMPHKLIAALAHALDAPLPPPAPGLVRGASRAQPHPPGTLGTTVLLVEDNATNQQVAALTLTELGYRVAIASDGLAAVNAVANAIVQDVGYDLILMDCQMPVLDGYEATRQIRQLPIARWAEVPIIAMTANAMPGDRERCLAAGMDDYIAKPFQLDALQKMLTHWLDRANARGEPIGTFVASEEVQDERPIVWDRPALEALARNKPERITHLLNSFLTSVDATCAEIVDALELEQDEHAEKLIHGLKGAAANLGARALPAFLLQLEAQLREQAPLAARDSLIRRFNQHIAELKLAFRVYLSAQT